MKNGCLLWPSVLWKHPLRLPTVCGSYTRLIHTNTFSILWSFSSSHHHLFHAYILYVYASTFLYTYMNIPCKCWPLNCSCILNVDLFTAIIGDFCDVSNNCCVLLVTMSQVYCLLPVEEEHLGLYVAVLTVGVVLYDQSFTIIDGEQVSKERLFM